MSEALDYWSLEEAVELCRIVEAVCQRYGCHVALTGGALYKDGKRKDCDLLFYRIRQIPAIDLDGLWVGLAGIGLEKVSGFGWVFKAKAGALGKNVDCFFPEEKAVTTSEVRTSKNSGIQHY